MGIAIAKEYYGPMQIEHDNALEWCKACLQRRIDEDHLEDQVDWSELIVKDEKVNEDSWYIMTCRLPLKE